MRRFRFWILILAAFLLPAALAVWAFSEVRSQQREVEDALRAEAALLARALGPALASASASARELDELLAWKLLDNARLLARLESAAPLGERELADLLEANGLDAFRRLAADGAVRRRGGAAVDDEALRERLAPLLRREAEELFLGAHPENGERYAVAAVATRDGGAVVTMADPAQAYAFARQIGVDNLLRTLVDTHAVLYLVYEERPGDVHAEASWDARPVPSRPQSTVRGRPVFEVAMPVAAPAGRRASLRVGLHGEPLQRATVAALRRTALVGVVLAAFGLASAGFTIVQRARAREREQTRHRLAGLEESRRRGERLAAAGALAAGLAHEVRNPLNGIGMAAQRIERLAAAEGERGGRARQLAALIRQEVARLEDTLKGFLDLARPASGPQGPLDLADLTRGSLGLLELEAADRGLRVELHAEPAPAMGDAEALRGAVVNLLRNALQASPAGGSVEVDVSAGRGGTARITVRDHGPGIDPDLLARAFDAFVTTRAHGTGLGLAMVRRVADEHGGRSWLHNHPEGGVEAGFEIPARAAVRTVA
jgi:signal transduction histidine kinase